MRYLLDTNAVIALLKLKPAFLSRLKQHEPDEIALPAIVMHELFDGACRSARRDANLRHIRLLPFQVLDFGERDALAAGEIRARLAETGKLIGPCDVLIAGQALARGSTVVTRNTDEFMRVEGLAIEDWESAG